MTLGFGEKRCPKNLPLSKVQPMRFAIILVLALAPFIGCGSPFGSARSALKPIASPDGTMTLTPLVNQSKADPTKYLCVAFDVHDKSNTFLHQVQSSASDIQKWAIGWFDDSTIVLYSSDIGTYAWKIAGDGSISQLPHPLPAEINDYGDRIKASEY